MMTISIASAQEQVQKAYIAYFGRPADPAGLELWTQELVGGASIGGIIQAFGNSAESQALYGGDTAEQQITRIYQQLFNRSPDEAGLSYWVNNLETGAISLQAAALTVLSGAVNEDRTLIDAKLNAAKVFTWHLNNDQAGNTYKGEEDATLARNFLSQVTVQTASAQIEADARQLIDTIFDNTWYEFGGNLTSSYNPVFVANGSETYYLNDSNYFNSNYQDSVFIARVGSDLSTPFQLKLGGAEDLHLDAAVVNQSGGIVVAGDYAYSNSGYAYVASLDSELGNLKSAMIGTGQGDVDIMDVTTRANGNIVAVGQQSAVADNDDAYIVEFDANMNVLYERRLDNAGVTNSREELENVVALDDGSTIAWNDDGDFVSFDQTMQLKKAVSFNFDPDSLVQLDNGNLLFSTDNYATDVVLMDSSLNVLNAWDASGSSFKDFTINDAGHIVASWGSRFNGNYDSFFTFDVSDFAAGVQSITSTDAKYITGRNGYTKDIEDILPNGSNFILQGDDDLFTYKPNHETSPNLAAEYRFIEGNLPLKLEALSQTESNYPFSQNIATEAFDVGLAGVPHGLDTVGVSGGINIREMDVL